MGSWAGGIWVLPSRSQGPGGTRGKLRQAPRPLTFEDHHARLGTDPLDPGCPGQVVAVRVVAGPALVGARILCSELVDGHAAGRVLLVGGVDVDAVQPSAVPELGAGIIGTIPFKPPLDLGDGAAHGLAVQLHTAPRPPLLGQWGLDEAGYRERVSAAIIMREERREGKGSVLARMSTPQARAQSWLELSAVSTASLQLTGGTGHREVGKQDTRGPSATGAQHGACPPRPGPCWGQHNCRAADGFNWTRDWEARGCD